MAEAAGPDGALILNRMEPHLPSTVPDCSSSPIIHNRIADSIHAEASWRAFERSFFVESLGVWKSFPFRICL
jgi:hypothetical protein